MMRRRVIVVAVALALGLAATTMLKKKTTIYDNGIVSMEVKDTTQLEDGMHDGGKLTVESGCSFLEIKQSSIHDAEAYLKNARDALDKVGEIDDFRIQYRAGNPVLYQSVFYYRHGSMHGEYRMKILTNSDKQIIAVAYCADGDDSGEVIGLYNSIRIAEGGLDIED